MNQRGTMQDSSSMPRVFISSVYAEVEPNDASLRHFRLRRALWEMGKELGIPVWVAEYCGLGNDGSWKSALKACLDELANSDLLVVLLAHRSGAPVLVSKESGKTASSIFEVELFYASQWRIPTIFYVVGGYEPEVELANLIRILQLRRERGWVQVDESSVVSEARKLFTSIGSVPIDQWRIRFLPDRLAEDRSFASVGEEIRSTRLSFIDRFSPRRQTEYSQLRFAELMRLAAGATTKVEQLGFLWMAMRELSSGGSGKDRAEEWRDLAKLWSSAAAWLGLHGALNTGVLSALHTQTDLAARIPLKGVGVPYGPLASEMYSTALICETALWKRRRFMASIELATREANHSADPSGAIAIRGSAKLRLSQLGRLWLIPEALMDYRMVLRIRERNGSSDSSIGEALVEYGFAQFAVRSRIHIGVNSSLKRMLEGVRLMESDSSMARIGFLVRGKRKLALALAQAGRHDEATVERTSANDLARLHGVLGQLNREERRPR